jgi:hypothetical protein
MLWSRLPPWLTEIAALVTPKSRDRVTRGALNLAAHRRFREHRNFAEGWQPRSRLMGWRPLYNKPNQIKPESTNANASPQNTDLVDELRARVSVPDRLYGVGF